MTVSCYFILLAHSLYLSLIAKQMFAAYKSIRFYRSIRNIVRASNSDPSDFFLRNAFLGSPGWMRSLKTGTQNFGEHGVGVSKRVGWSQS